MTKQQLQQDLKQSMLSKNAEKTSVLRLVLSAINYYEIQKGGANYEATEEDVLTVLQKEAKQRKDSIEQFIQANRTDLADKEKQELNILESYLPQQMSEDEIKILVESAIQSSGATTLQEIGKVMGVLMPQVKGKADGSLVNKIVKEKLSS